MDGFLNLAKQGYEAYSESQHGSNVSKTGGQEYNSPDNSGRDQSYDGPQINHHEAIRTAQQHGSGDGSTYSSALGYLEENKHAHNDPVDEDEVRDAHDQAYNQGNGGNLSAGSLGSAAALQTMKKFTSGGSGGGSQTDLISMAMAEATKLFDQSGGAASGNKQDAVNGAAMTVMKLLVQSKLGGGMMGGGNSGGLSGLMGLASKFV